jgi:hypothetical protein
MIPHATPAALALGFLGHNLARVYRHPRHNLDQFAAALSFLDLVPLDVATPMAGVNGHGQAFFWWEDGDMSLAVIPDEDGISFLASFGREERRGRERFNGLVLPVLLTELLHVFKRVDA